MESVDPSDVTVGVDFGQKSDPTAIVVTQMVRRTIAWPDPAKEAVAFWTMTEERTETRFVGRRIERLPLGTSYPKVAKRVADIVRGIHDLRPRNLAPSSGPTIIADATGLGTPVLDILKEELAVRRLACRVTGATFTHGQKLTGAVGGDQITVGKGYLVSRLQSLLQTARIDLPRTAEAIALKEELLAYDIKIDPDGDAKFGAFRTGTHDDLATALGLAVLADEPGGSSWGDLTADDIAAWARLGAGTRVA
jgi:hypothetical protein